MQDKSNQILQEYFGYSAFKQGQKAIIDRILKGQDVLGIMPTGAGKSICYQVPALCLGGTALVISPLISMMKDQVDTLNELGIEAAFINSSLNPAEYREVMSRARKQEYKLLYIAPERLDTDSFQELAAALDISIIAIDEAHCVSEWGHDFRPSYTKIAELITGMDKRPIVAAFTATATPRVKEDVEKLLGLRRPYVLVTGFDREKLYFQVEKPSDKFSYLLNYVRKSSGASGIIYCSTRKTVESVCEKLNRKGIKAVRYHAGLGEEERTANQEAFIYDRVQVIVATNAFGMGIDKSNIRYVIHYNMPKTMENYYQEAGRAGRDGERAECILLFSAADTVMNKFLIENSGEGADKSEDYKKLQEIVDYCNTDSCLRGYILRYFGEQEYPQSCDNCGNCLSNKEQTDITVEAQKILSCIKRAGGRFGSGMIIDILRGANTGRLKDLGFDKLGTYGIMEDYSKDTIREIIAYLVSESFINVKGDKYPMLSVSSRAGSILEGEDQLIIKRLIAKAGKEKHKSGVDPDKELFERLRLIRKNIAEGKGVPPFVIFSDATLTDMCSKLPADREAMLGVSGVGAFKLEKYGDPFIREINEYMADKKLIHEAAVKEEQEKGEVVKTAKPKKEDTRLMTYEMYISGKSIGEIAWERGLTQITVEGHLVDCLEKGLDLDYQCLIPEEQEAEIMKAIDNFGTDRLKPIKEAVSAEVTYTAIRFAIWKYKNLPIR
ncbi:MAG: DNA helicase RecQ [Pseudomonadota bacterium]